jgi:hypothetical protein
MVCGNVLVVPFYQTSAAPCGAVGDCIRKINAVCDENGIPCIVVGKTNSPDHVTRIHEFENACKTAFKDAQTGVDPTCIIINANNGDGIERGTWQRYLQDNSEVCYADFVTDSLTTDSLVQRVSKKHNANVQVAKMQRARESSVPPSGPRISMKSVREGGKVRISDGSTLLLKKLVDEFSAKCTDKSHATYVDKWPEPPRPKTPINWDEEDDDTANVDTKARVREIVTATFAVLRQEGFHW